ncbi:hypothetical protein CMV30_03360 [Nibricoccus aquaticus]|uniref:Uncharacterized protein n=1 Tax=Nibricoccus aquaticus TaxID=2576891 RepID=A0A290QFE3_9BACT|nr:hypothetical protein [Nibricoccus aquaticus]ATC63071.1 hypothetical protein CMV30_03360 [Nibricoccus aquaticus]
MSEAETLYQWLMVAARDRDIETLVLILDFLEEKGPWGISIRTEVHFLRAFIRRLVDLGNADTAARDWHVVVLGIVRLKVAMLQLNSPAEYPQPEPTGNLSRQ